MKIGFEFIGRQRFAAVKALNFVTTLVAQNALLSVGLDAFGNGFEAQALGHADDRADNSFVLGIGADVAYERTVNLELVNPEFLQMAE